MRSCPTVAERMARQKFSRNRLLSALSAADQRRMNPHLEVVPLALKQSLEKPNTRIDRVYFPEEGIASVVAIGSANREVEVGLVGPEGMTGTTIVLGNHRSPNSTYVQAVGEARSMQVAELRKAMAASASLRSVLLKYVHAFMIQTAHTAVANARAGIEERLARWLLMAHDRLSRDTLPLTHEFLALMLGVRRAGVTDAVNALEGERLIRASRGHIIVLDRKGLERRAKESYGAPEAEYRRLLG
jgi:CRP-like cAMP-binding protein